MTGNLSKPCVLAGYPGRPGFFPGFTRVVARLFLFSK